MGAVKLDFSQVSTVSLESQLQRLALEADVLANVVTAFKSVVPNLASKLESIYDSFTTEDDTATALKAAIDDYGKLKLKLPHAKYVDYTRTMVSVPEGFKGELLAYLNSLHDISPLVFSGANEVLAEYNFVLSSFITNKDSKTALKDHTEMYKRIAKLREKMSDIISAYFTAGNLPKQYLGDTVHRFTDLDAIIKISEKLHRDRKAQNVKEIAESVRKSVDMLKIIVADSENKGIHQVSGNAAMNVSQGAYEIGKYVEFISIYRYRVEQAVSCVQKLIETLDKVI